MPSLANKNQPLNIATAAGNNTRLLQFRSRPPLLLGTKVLHRARWPNPTLYLPRCLEAFPQCRLVAHLMQSTQVKTSVQVLGKFEDLVLKPFGLDHPIHEGNPNSNVHSIAWAFQFKVAQLGIHVIIIAGFLHQPFSSSTSGAPSRCRQVHHLEG